MQKFLIATGAAALLAASSFGALAFEQRATITSVDPDADTVTIASGETLKLPEGFDAAELSPGQQIMVEYDASTMMIDKFDVITDGDVMEDTRGDEN
jgi:hypothetical protein